MYDLSCASVTKSFGSFTAVRDVSLDIPSGSFFSILGPSGCGKTTLMRMIAGFETPTSGDIAIKGQSVVTLPPNKRNVKMVFQHLALFPMMTVGENIAYGLRCRKEPKSEIAPKVARVLDRVGLPGSQDKRIDQLSGGQKQRIAIARCMVLEPDVLLLDEPLGALDLKLREHMKIELKQLQHQFETTFLYITHDQSEALVMSDNVAVMNAGRFEQIGPPKALYDAPASGFVAGFVGDSNVLPGRLAEVKGDEARVEVEGGGTVIGRVADASKPGDAVEVFLRPEALRIGAGGEGTSLSGTVESFLFNGASSRILVRSGAHLIEVADPEQSGAAAQGGAVSVAWTAEKARIFARRPS
ncbi:ABC transporter ATP-binding protein [Primorskyibacter flagellatus]|uniref:ABC transporter ATP-binding protein n=1 Tax=Primorskyibacter flagellatus TaxID=1387277 RepID=A0A916ZZ27_9RHOB|nr:ABC transporter ATP-binding protein [Primorskyibacter flagellatus]GGE19169.1 ABC transporter ATP-binding protein [Primorskyibacter flagellatus]